MSINDYERSEEIRKLEQESGVEYVDYVGQYKKSIEDGNSPYNGKNEEDISTLKDIGYSAAGAFTDYIQSIGEIGYNIGYGVAGLVEEGKWATSSDEEKKETWINPEQAYESKTTAGSITQGLTKATAGIATGGALLKAAGLTGAGGIVTNSTLQGLSKTKEGLAIGKILAPALNGMAGDALAFWKDDENLSNILKDNIDNPIIKKGFDYLAIQDDDGSAERAFKQALEGVFISGFAEATFKGFKYIKDGRKSKAIVSEMQGPLTKEAMELSKPLEGKAKGKKLKEVVKEATDGEVPSIAVPRMEEKVNYARLKKEAAGRIADEMGIDFSEMNETQLKEFIDKSSKETDKVIASIEFQENASNSFLERMKKLKDGVDDGSINKSSRDSVVLNNLSDLAKAFGAVQDSAAESGRALGYVSKSETHKNIKDIMNSIINNADTVDTNNLYKIFSEAGSIEELAAKLKKIEGLAKTNGINGVCKKFVALEQAGLMTNVATISRNVFSGVEMLFAGAADSVAGGIVGGGLRSLKRAITGKAGNATAADISEGARLMGSLINNSIEVINYGLQRLSKNADSMNKPTVSKYRNIVNGASTYMPEQVGKTFKGDGYMSRVGNAWMRYSGVGISEKIDDFMGSVFYRSEASSLASNYADKVALEKGLSKVQRDALYKKTLDGTLDLDTSSLKSSLVDVDDYLMDTLAEYSIMKKAKSYSLEQTFRSGEGEITKVLTKSANALPFVKMFVPFVKTASTISFDRFLADRTLLGLVSPRVINNLKQGGKSFDRAIGKQLVGNGLLTMGAYGFMNGNVTGDIPKNKAERDAWIANGIQPNSIVVRKDDGSVKYISLDGFGPLSMAIKAGANIARAVEEYDLESDDRDLIKSIMIYSQVIGEEAAGNTLFRYMGDFMTSISRNDEEALNKIIDRVKEVPLAVIPRINDNNVLFADKEAAMQVADNTMDRLGKKLGFETADKLDLFGRPIPAKERSSLAILGIRTTESKPDVVLDEMFAVGAYVEEPYKKMTIDNVSIKLDPAEARNVKNTMNSMNVYGEMKKIIQSPTYKYLDVEMKRDILRNVYNSIKKEALYKEIQLNPDLKDKLTKQQLSDSIPYDIKRSDVKGVVNVPTFTR